VSGTWTPAALALGILVGVVHFFSENIKPAEGRIRNRVVSFAAGISIAYLFLRLLPATYKAAFLLKEWVFAFLLAGFAVFHLVEKFTYRHAERDKLMRELKEIHSISFFIYYFTVGIVLELFMRVGPLDGVLFAVPVGLHAGLSSASLSEIHGDMRESLLAKIVLSLSTILGVGFAAIVGVPSLVRNILVSLIAGVMLYIIVKELLPEKEKGQPIFFVVGVVLFSAVNYALALLISRGRL
jgi:zinc transporter ZupT